MHDPYVKGETAQLMVQLRAIQKGFVVSKPTVEARYDLIIDTGTTLERAQIKYADCWTKYGSLELDLRKETRNNGKKKVYASDEVDVLYIYVPRYHRILRIDGELFHNKKSIFIRLLKITPAQMKGSLLMDDVTW